MKKFTIKFHRPSKYTAPITETAMVTIEKFKGYVYEQAVSRNVVEALKPYAEPEADKLDCYAAIAAFYNANPSDFVIENVIPVA